MDENGDLNFKINQDQKTIEKVQNTQNFGEIKIDNFEGKRGRFCNFQIGNNFKPNFFS